MIGYPAVNLQIGDNLHPATFDSHLGRYIRFKYLIQDDDHDADGISMAADAIELVAGSRIESQATDELVDRAGRAGTRSRSSAGSARPGSPSPSQRPEGIGPLAYNVNKGLCSKVPKLGASTSASNIGN